MSWKTKRTTSNDFYVSGSYHFDSFCAQRGKGTIRVDAFANQVYHSQSYLDGSLLAGAKTAE